MSIKQYPVLQVGTNNLVAGAVSTPQIANGAVGASQLANKAVGTSNIQDYAVTSQQLSGLSVGTTHLQNYAVTTNQLADNAVVNSKLAANSVGNSQIASNSIATAQIQDRSITATKISTSNLIGISADMVDNLHANQIASGKISRLHTFSYNASTNIYNTAGSWQWMYGNNANMQVFIDTAEWNPNSAGTLQMRWFATAYSTTSSTFVTVGVSFNSVASRGAFPTSAGTPYGNSWVINNTWQELVGPWFNVPGTGYYGVVGATTAAYYLYHGYNIGLELRIL